MPCVEKDDTLNMGDNMPRTAREKSETGLYHVMLRGIDKRELFLNDQDYQKFIGYIQKAREKTDFTVYAYCLMSNHIHIIIKTETQDIGDIVRRITVGYAQYHNVQNGRTGHLFQNRFRSEPLDSDTYFLAVLRYIHQKPLKAGMVNNIEDYKWSSFKAYIEDKPENMLVETTFGLDLFKDVKHFESFMRLENNDQCLEYSLKRRYTDDDLKEFVASFVDIKHLKELDIGSRDKVLANIKVITTSSNRQLARVLDIGRGIIEKVKQT